MVACIKKQRIRMKVLPICLLIFISIMYGCVFSKEEVAEKDNWINFSQKMKEHPRFKNEISEFQEQRFKMIGGDFDYDNYLESRATYLNQVKNLVDSDKNDSLKLGVLTQVLASNSLVNAKEKEKFFALVNQDVFSEELMDNYRGYLGEPKYQIGDSLDVEKILSYKAENEIPLELDSEVNIIFFWSSWCANCDRYYAPLDNLIGKYSDTQLNVIGLSLDQKESTMRKYEEKHAFRFKSYSDLNKKWRSVNAERFGVDGIPACFVIDKDKSILLVNPQANYLERMVDGIIKKTKA